jgi:hypothetical protein
MVSLWQQCISVLPKSSLLTGLVVHLNYGPVHLAYNTSYSACFFQSEQYFSLTKNQPTVFFSRLIIPAERLLQVLTGFVWLQHAVEAEICILFYF